MSWIEVESKVRIKNPEEIRERVKGIAKFVKKQGKFDEYFALGFNKKGFPRKKLRVRKEGGKSVINFKKEINYKQGVWAKKEVEFSVKDIKNFFELLKNFGFEEWIKKYKKTELYRTQDGVGIELNYVKKLGWFVEIEYLCKESDIDKARKRVIEIRKKLELPEREVIKPGYTSQLRKNKS